MSFKQHLREAMKLNKERKPVYAKMSKGSSKIISNILIFSEWITLPIAWYFEKRASKWNRVGIDIITADFISMEHVKVPDHPVKLGKIKRVWLFPTLLSVKIAIKYLLYSFSGIQTLTKSLCDELDQSYNNAMTKHILESIWFIAKNTENYINLAKQKGVKSPKSLSRDLIFLHLTALPLANIIDVIAEPVQKRGVPIIINDIPPIR